ncbi:MAG: single-stranded DNA-binding protein [Xylanivirga thermophila]|uniref:single-stranded DNA-binding protein n=1 Tax=Xylanivirga thermophila TaxID=2496273 RepID=UPI001A919D31|nr:single-stranded DNA-binding protein [Xylanivirga thermophila]
MGDNKSESNKVLLSGTVDSPLQFSHQIYGEGFYDFNLSIPRLSGYVDLLPVTVSERLLTGDTTLSPGAKVVVEGQLRSYNKFLNGASRLILTVFARDISMQQEELKNPNQIYLNGFICKPPIYRVTPFKREIADLLLAVNRPYNKSDYIPAIAWGRNARFCSTLSVGDNIVLWGRIQSRQYQKKLSEDNVVEKTAYEVSITKMEAVKQESS